eukprot:TRINITY_DN74585_c0_g1_i1.p1 TRINITY_DN74585_c0_g1~~TRINITY_DN74585_c0_g1_i1.p1  ORF type:complete len:368 (+),score=70.68 TRINITY_DN74585_c0_g1_i1:94-1197(+)
MPCDSSQCFGRRSGLPTSSRSSSSPKGGSSADSFFGHWLSCIGAREGELLPHPDECREDAGGKHHRASSSTATPSSLRLPDSFPAASKQRVERSGSASSFLTCFSDDDARLAHREVDRRCRETVSQASTQDPISDGQDRTSRPESEDGFDGTGRSLGASPMPQQDWWSMADLTFKGLDCCKAPFRLLEARGVRHPEKKGGYVPWKEGQSQDELYELMGMRDTSKKYMALWSTMGSASLLLVAEVTCADYWQILLEDEEYLMDRLKLILNPVKVDMPFPLNGPAKAETVGAFFGRRNVNRTLGRTAKGVEHICLQMDLYSKWILKFGMKTLAFKRGNIVDLLYVDWKGQATACGVRLNMTDVGVELFA